MNLTTNNFALNGFNNGQCNEDTRKCMNVRFRK